MPDRVRMNLEIESNDPMTGHLVDEQGQVHSFRGWLELNSAIQALSHDGEARLGGDREGTRAANDE